MLVKSNGGADFKALAARLKAAGKDGAAIRKALTKELQGELKDVVADIQASVKSVKTTAKRASHGGGYAQRRRFDASADYVRALKAAKAGKVARSRKAPPHGLRARIARGVKSRVKWSGFKYGAQVVVDTTGLPRSERRLPKHLNNPKGWRHPVFGNRENWTTQSGEPYFDRAIAKHIPRIRRVVKAAVDRTMERIK